MKAVDVLRMHQKQLDPDGIEVGVSRQALDEVIAEHRQLLIDLAGKDAVIEVLKKDVELYKRYQTEKYAKT